MKEITCIITETVSNTNSPPIIAKTISCFAMMATAANDPPSDNDPVSPIKIFAGGALYHKNPRHDPTIEPQKLKAHQHQEYIVTEDNLKKIVFPTMYEIKVNDRATNITGTVASPSRPSVKLTAFEEPIITNKPKGIKKIPICKIKFLKNGKYKLYK